MGQIAATDGRSVIYVRNLGLDEEVLEEMLRLAGEDFVAEDINDNSIQNLKERGYSLKTICAFDWVLRQNGLAGITGVNLLSKAPRDFGYQQKL
jgi:hypothetical protein